MWKKTVQFSLVQRPKYNESSFWFGLLRFLFTLQSVLEFDPNTQKINKCAKIVQLLDNFGRTKSSKTAKTESFVWNIETFCLITTAYCLTTYQLSFILMLAKHYSPSSPWLQKPIAWEKMVWVHNWFEPGCNCFARTPLQWGLGLAVHSTPVFAKSPFLGLVRTEMCRCEHATCLIHWKVSLTHYCIELRDKQHHKITCGEPADDVLCAHNSESCCLESLIRSDFAEGTSNCVAYQSRSHTLRIIPFVVFFH